MLDAKKIQELFGELNEELRLKNEIGEVGIVGGAVMCLVYQARKATKDVDGIFAPTQLMRELIAKVGRAHRLQTDWLNDAAKGFLTEKVSRQEVLSFSNLRVWAPDARYMLAMKCLSARWDSHDRDDVIFLIRRLKYKHPDEVLALIEEYYPKNRISPKTQFLVEEVFERFVKAGK